MVDIRNKIFEIMHYKQISNNDFADRMKIHPTGVSRLKRHNINMSLETFVRICKALDVTPNELLNWNQTI